MKSQLIQVDQMIHRESFSFMIISEWILIRQQEEFRGFEHALRPEGIFVAPHHAAGAPGIRPPPGDGLDGLVHLAEGIDAAAEGFDLNGVCSALPDFKGHFVRRIGDHTEVRPVHAYAQERRAVIADLQLIPARLNLGADLIGQVAAVERQAFPGDIAEGEAARALDDGAVDTLHLDAEIAEASTEPEEVIVKRTIKANTWSTLTLPFELSGDQIAEIFGDDAKIAEFLDYDTNEKDQYVVEFESIDPSDGLQANYPYIIKTSEAISEFLVKNVEVDAQEDEAYVNYDNGRAPTHPRYEWYAKMLGTLHNGVTVPKNGFFLRDNKFYVSEGSSVLKGFRAYFIINGYEFFGSDANISFAVDGETTAIEGVSVNGTEIVSGDVYNVNGTFMGRAENVMKSLPRGIYIVNNKKVVVK